VEVSVVNPTLIEAANLPHVLPLIPDVVDEVVIVDGGSVDGTVDVVRTLRPDAQIVIDRRPGKGRALRTGFQQARGDIIVMIDADGSMDPRDIPTFVAVLRGGADVAKGSRFVQGGGTADMSTIRYLGNWVLRQAVRVAFGGRYSDLCYGYMAFWRHVLPTFEAPRLHGESHLRTFRDGTRVLRTIARERRELTRCRAGRGVPRPVAMPGWADQDALLAPTAPAQLVAAIAVPSQNRTGG
jgi:glycosyltransferase involved in cell wall biosynthesis